MSDSGGGGTLGALFFVVGLLLLFCVLFSTFLIVPFFIFMAGIVAMVISDRKRGKDEQPKSETQESGS
ncbi:MAG: hypothetical protein M3Y45_09230 [Actinomycetota bacterium]|nr:hypothetical protein [Actinomycetota bacterium]